MNKDLYKAIREVKLAEELLKIQRMENSVQNKYIASLSEEFKNELISFAEAKAPKIRKVVPKVGEVNPTGVDIINKLKADAEAGKITSVTGKTDLETSASGKGNKKTTKAEPEQQSAPGKGDAEPPAKPAAPPNSGPAATVPSSNKSVTAAPPAKPAAPPNSGPAATVPSVKSGVAVGLGLGTAAAAGLGGYAAYQQNKGSAAPVESDKPTTRSLNAADAAPPAANVKNADGSAKTNTTEIQKTTAPVDQKVDSAPAAPVDSAPAAKEIEKYTINKGDTLSGLAKKWNVSVNDIMKSNQDLKNPHKIMAGAELIKPKETGNPIYQYGIGTKAGTSETQNIQKPKIKTESTEMPNKLIDSVIFKLNEYKNLGYGGKGDPYQGRNLQPYMNQKDIPAALKVKETPAAPKPTPKSAPAASPVVPKPTPKPEIKNTTAPYDPLSSIQAPKPITKNNRASETSAAASIATNPANRNIMYTGPDNPRIGLEFPKRKIPSNVSKRHGPMPISGERSSMMSHNLSTDIGDVLADKSTVLKYNSDPITTTNQTFMQQLTRKAADKKNKLQTEELSQMSNKLIDSFMKLQSLNSSNIFEAAKKVKKLDPVGKEDEDINNDGKKDSTDSYLHNRRKAIKAAMKEGKDPNAELDAPSSGGKAPETSTNPEWLKKMKPQEQTPTSNLKGSLPKGVTVKGNTNEEVEFSEAELAHIAAILEGPVAPTPDDYSGSKNGPSVRNLSDETVSEEEVKRGRGRPKGSKSGSAKGEGQAAGTPHIMDQIKFASARGIADGKGNYMLKHPTSGETRAVPQKAANDAYRDYHGEAKPAGKNAVLSGFLKKHGFSDTSAEKAPEEKRTTAEPKKSVSLPSMPKPKS